MEAYNGQRHGTLWARRDGREARRAPPRSYPGLILGFCLKHTLAVPKEAPTSDQLQILV